MNNELVDAEKAAISVADSGLLYGAGLFETMRSRNGVVFRVEDHLDRLLLSAAALSIDHPFDKPRLRSALDRVLEANDLKDARLRLTLTNGPLAESEDQRRPTLLITAAEFRPYPSDCYKTGVLVVLCPFRQNPTDPTSGHKTTNYYPRLLALNRAHRQRAAEALWFTTDGRLAEGCVSNVFLVKDSALHTPSVQTPVLPGIARKTVLQVAKEQSIETVEKDLYIADLLGADEVFLTNIVMEVLPVAHIEQHTVGNGKVGPVTQRLRESFVVAVEQECGRQP
ncbi:MAG TPA: aminotransferase class IV [Sedimentisphaerales bacterium]|nr:aminotransferase class IV [Sedimentisphaerales bacterium]HNU31822.1 aminotransferase class IV [Sedimentisphaerales bacterium]